MNKHKITQKDTKEISALITRIVGRQHGVSYQCNLWLQPKANEDYTTITDWLLVSDLTGEYYEDIMDEDGCLDCYTFHNTDMLHECKYISIKLKDGEWTVSKYY